MNAETPIQLVRINIQEFVNTISLQRYFSHDLIALGTRINEV